MVRKPIRYGRERFTMTLDDPIIEKEMGKGFYEPWLLDAIKQYCSGGVWIDGGANFGNHTVFFDRMCYNTQIIAFEPDKDNFELLKHNIQDNKCKKTIAYQAGLGRTKSKANIIKGKRNSQHVLETSKNGTVDIVSIDGMELENVRVIKLDVEGFEMEALHGAVKTIERDKPDLFIEIWTDLQPFKDLLEPFGYELKNRYCHAPVYHFSTKDIPVQYKEPQ